MGETDPVRYQTPRGGHQTNHLEAEIKTLREQLGLLHLQLQYERHRREVHAVRNRRLLGESRSNKALEEHNSALRDQLTLLQKEIESLHEQLTSKKQDSVMRERELQEIVSYWHTQCLQAQDLNKRLREDADNLQRTLTDLQQIHQATASQYQTAEARLFQVESEMENALAQARDSQRIAADLERMRTELLLAGEINHRFQERLTQLPLIRHRDDEMSLLTAAYHDEIKSKFLIWLLFSCIFTYIYLHVSCFCFSQRLNFSLVNIVFRLKSAVGATYFVGGIIPCPCK